MEPLTLRDRAAIVGIGQTEFSKSPGASELQLACEAVRAAIADAGLQPSDVDGLVTFVPDTNDELALMTRGRHPGGAVDVAHAVRWWWCVGARSSTRPPRWRRARRRWWWCTARSTSARATGSGSRGAQVSAPIMNLHMPFGLDTPAKMYSLWFQRYMHVYGLTNEDFGRYTVVARKHAANNPNAWFYGRPITLADHQASRWIVEPILRLLDCCQESDGGVAIVVTTPERARDCAPAAGGGERGDAGQHDDRRRCCSTTTTTTSRRSPRPTTAPRSSTATPGLAPADIDVAMIYENFSPVVFYQLEAYGFCGRGEAKDFIADGQIEVGGATPVNTNGGLLGEAYIHGMNNLIEGVRQLRGESCNQVDDAQHVLVARRPQRGHPQRGVMDLQLDGKVAIVTGASRGIGLAAAAAFVREGARVVMVARKEYSLRAAAEELGPNAYAVVGNVGNEGAGERIVAAAHDAFGRVDVIVNNAAHQPVLRRPRRHRLAARTEDGHGEPVGTARLVQAAWNAGWCDAPDR